MSCAWWVAHLLFHAYRAKIGKREWHKFEENEGEKRGNLWKKLTTNDGTSSTRQEKNTFTIPQIKQISQIPVLLGGSENIYRYKKIKLQIKKMSGKKTRKKTVWFDGFRDEFV